ncbi:hypothetical protein DIPPA_17670 [Diplonema papillatum]|nr:hypothetical protein DIPPA_17670 [Diplonema papillatum]
MLRRTRVHLSEGQFTGDAAYQLLGVRKSSDLAAIRKVYFEHAKSVHPDMNLGLDAVDIAKKAQRFSEIKAAHEWIKEHHAEMDQSLREVRQVAEFKAAAQSHAQDRRPVVPSANRAPLRPKAEAVAQAREFVLKKQRKEAPDERQDSSKKAPKRVFSMPPMPRRPRAGTSGSSGEVLTPTSPQLDAEMKKSPEEARQA